jgi:beta-phosphoglucomutase-like phosphatase (HAD superfamily)
MAMLKSPAAYLFDMDGLLLDTERMFLSAFVKLTDELQIAREEAEAFLARWWVRRVSIAQRSCTSFFQRAPM